MPASGWLGMTNTERGRRQGLVAGQGSAANQSSRLILIDSKEVRNTGEGKSTPRPTLESERGSTGGLAAARWRWREVQVQWRVLLVLSGPAASKLVFDRPRRNRL